MDPIIQIFGKIPMSCNIYPQYCYFVQQFKLTMQIHEGQITIRKMPNEKIRIEVENVTSPHPEVKRPGLNLLDFGQNSRLVGWSYQWNSNHPLNYLFDQLNHVKNNPNNEDYFQNTNNNLKLHGLDVDSRKAKGDLTGLDLDIAQQLEEKQIVTKTYFMTVLLTKGNISEITLGNLLSPIFIGSYTRQQRLELLNDAKDNLELLIQNNNHLTKDELTHLIRLHRATQKLITKYSQIDVIDYNSYENSTVNVFERNKDALEKEKFQLSSTSSHKVISNSSNQSSQGPSIDDLD